MAFRVRAVQGQQQPGLREAIGADNPGDVKSTIMCVTSSEIVWVCQIQFLLWFEWNEASGRLVVYSVCSWSILVSLCGLELQIARCSIGVVSLTTVAT